MAVKVEELQEEKLTEHLKRLFKRDYLLERKDVKATLRMYKEAKKEMGLIKKELKKGMNPGIEARKKKLLNDMVKFLILRKKSVGTELVDINEEYKELQIEEHDEQNLLQGR